MKRRNFFTTGALAALGTTVLNPFRADAAITDVADGFRNRKARNIIFLVSDGMSTGTLNMTDLYLNRKLGRSSHWIDLYRTNKVSRALMDTASASSIVTDSSAGSSSWGGGVRVPNGSLNVGANGEEYLPIWQKFKKAGKMAGCVTTVPITHATPAGFCVNSKSRSSQDEIAVQYLDLGFDVMMGGGNKYFDAGLRKDKRDLYADFSKRGYQVARTAGQMASAANDKPILGVFADDGLPYSADHVSAPDLKTDVPTLAQMTQKAINRMKRHPKGFVLQVEGGKVDWAAHANDIAGLIFDQVAFDDAVKVAMDFAQADGNTLVIVTTDHGNANPGVIYGKAADANFDSISRYRQTNEWVLNQIKPDFTTSKVRELIEYAQATAITDEEAQTLLGHYSGLEKEDGGLYNYRKLPFRAFAEMQKKYNSVGWISMDHSSDYVELAMYGPGSGLLKPFVKNTDLHYLMLEAAEVENRF